MGLIIREKAVDKELREISGHFKGYIKVVVDIERAILSAGGARHPEGEKKFLLKKGKKKKKINGGFVFFT